jgi:hypothetical protein
MGIHRFPWLVSLLFEFLEAIPDGVLHSVRLFTGHEESVVARHVGKQEV